MRRGVANFRIAAPNLIFGARTRGKRLGMEENMQNEYELKKLICDIGKRIYNRNMVAANDGNISVKLNDNEFLCTPTGVSKLIPLLPRPLPSQAFR